MTAKAAKAVALKLVRRPKGLVRKQQLAEQNPGMMFLGDTIDDTTYDEALIGMVQIPCKATVACYDYEKCVECLMSAHEEWERTDVIEWLEYNVVGAYVGDNGPVFFCALEDEES